MLTFGAAGKDNAQPRNAPVAQLDRVSGYEPEGRRFESFRARHFSKKMPSCLGWLFFDVRVQVLTAGIKAGMRGEIGVDETGLTP